MRLLAALAASAAVAFALSATAAAQPTEPPITIPMHDVSAVFHIEGSARDAVPGGLPETVTASWGASRQVLRLQPAGRSQVLLLDLRRPGLDVIDAVLHSVLTVPMQGRDLAAIRLDGATFTRLSEQTVAGLPCTEWAVAARRGKGRVCLTTDGLPLRGSGSVDGRDGRFVATSVQYGAVADTLLNVPSGYLRFPMPKIDRIR